MRRRLRTLLCLTIWLLAAACSAHGAEHALVVQELDVEAFPTVRLRVAAPPGSATADAEVPSFVVLENGRAVRNMEVRRVGIRSESLRVVLVIDVSGSMAGVPLRDAKRASLRFLDQLGQDAEVTVISFSDKATVASRSDEGREAHVRAINALSAGGETALYDAVAQAVKSTAEPAVDHAAIVVLTDGADTVSSSNLESSVEALRARGAPLYGVSLQSKERDEKGLSILAKRSGGRLVPAKRSGELAGIFDSIATELTESYDVSWMSSRPRTKDIDLDAMTEIAGAQWGAVFSYPNPDFLAPSQGIPLGAAEVRENPGLLLLSGGLVFVSVSLLTAGVITLSSRGRTGLQQLKFYDQLQVAADRAAAGDRDGLADRVVDAVGTVAGKRGLTRWLADRLERAGLPLRPAEYMTAHMLAVIASGVVAQIATDNLVVGLAVVIIGTVLPLMLLDAAVERRRAKFETQLPDVLDMISGSLRAGWGVQQALGLVSEEMQAPVADEFNRVVTEARLGIALETALQSMAARVISPDFDTVVTAMTIQRESGGNLTEVLDSVARTLRERAGLRRQVRALTAEGRLSAYVLVALPVVEVGLLLIINPGYLRPLYTTTMGIAMSTGALLLMLFGSWWLFRVTRIEV